MNESTLDVLGRLVRKVWVEYCFETGDTKPSHIAPWEELSEWDKEADRRIGARLYFEGLMAIPPCKCEEAEQ